MIAPHTRFVALLALGLLVSAAPFIHVPQTIELSSSSNNLNPAAFRRGSNPAESVANDGLHGVAIPNHAPDAKDAVSNADSSRYPAFAPVPDAAKDVSKDNKGPDTLDSSHPRVGLVSVPSSKGIANQDSDSNAIPAAPGSIPDTDTDTVSKSLANTGSPSDPISPHNIDAASSKAASNDHGHGHKHEHEHEHEHIHEHIHEHNHKHIHEHIHNHGHGGS